MNASPGFPVGVVFCTCKGVFSCKSLDGLRHAFEILGTRGVFQGPSQLCEVVEAVAAPRAAQRVPEHAQTVVVARRQGLAGLRQLTPPRLQIAGDQVCNVWVGFDPDWVCGHRRSQKIV